MKRFVALFFLLISVGWVFAGGQPEPAAADTPAEPVELQFVLPAGFPAISFAEFVADDPEIAPGFTVSYEVLQSSDLLSAKILSGEADVFVAPTNLGANLHGRNVDVRYVGSAVWGILYIVTSEEISGWDALRGREIKMLGRGLTPDIVFRYLLTENGVDPDNDVTLDYVQAATELAPTFMSGASTISIMPEPLLSMVTTNRPDTRILLDLQQEWADVSGLSESYPQASLFVTGEVADAYPEFVAALAEEYAAAIQRANTDPGATAAKAATFLDAPPAPVIARAIPGGNLRWIGADEARPALEEYLGVLLNFAPESVGGALPDDTFYFQTP